MNEAMLIFSCGQKLELMGVGWPPDFLFPAAYLDPFLLYNFPAGASYFIFLCFSFYPTHPFMTPILPQPPH